MVAVWPGGPPKPVVVSQPLIYMVSENSPLETSPVCAVTRTHSSVSSGPFDGEVRLAVEAHILLTVVFVFI